VDPDDPQDIARAVLRLEDPTRWCEAAQAGPVQAAAHTWEDSARTLLELARNLHTD
jgi:hypothetical protein